LGDDKRLDLVARLSSQGPMSITRLTSGSRITRQAVTKHLRVMEQAHLVHSHRHGRESLWQLDRRPLEEAQRYLAAISKQWDDALARLQRFVED
jgi:DNA-binding transcriptional ArsR family regulator